MSSMDGNGQGRPNSQAGSPGRVNLEPRGNMKDLLKSPNGRPLGPTFKITQQTGWDQNKKESRAAAPQDFTFMNGKPTIESINYTPFTVNFKNSASSRSNSR